MMEKYFQQLNRISITNTIIKKPNLLAEISKDNWNQQFSQSHYEVTGEFFLFPSLRIIVIIVNVMCWVALSDVARTQSCSYWNFALAICSPFNFNFWWFLFVMFSFFLLPTQIICSLDNIIWHFVCLWIRNPLTNIKDYKF